MVGSSLSHFKIVDELGRGGMGIVYKARDTKLDRIVAIKVLPAHALSNKDDRSRFYREARAAAQLSHANICHVYLIDEAAPGGGKGEANPFIAMEYIEGETLSERISRGPLPLKEAVRIASEIGSALQAAHEKNIVHRDVKSGNVMLTGNGEAKVLDFGLAKTAHSTMLTRMGSTVGTVAYMSPEQARGEDVDQRTDIWSLGVVLYEMITGRRPAPGDYEQAVVYSILNEPPAPLTSLRTGVPMRLEWMVNKCLAKDREDRYASVKDLLVDLRTLDLSDSGLSAAGVGPMSGAGSTGVYDGTGGAAAATPGRGSRGAWFSWPVVVPVAIGLFALGYIISSLSSPAPPERSVFRSHLVTDRPLVRSFGLSPDGRKLVFNAGDSTDRVNRLFVHDFRTGESRPIHNSAGGESPRFSYDGSRIAFIANNEVRTASSTGGDAITITSPAFIMLAWGPDRSIYYSTGPAIMRVAEGTNRIEEVARVDTSAGESIIRAHQVLPGGKYALGVVNPTAADGKIVVIDLTTGKRKTIIEGEFWLTQYVSSGYILASRGGIDTAELRAIPFDAESLTVSGPMIPVYRNTDYRSWAVSPSGLFVRRKFERRPEERTLKFVRFDTGEESVIHSDDLDYDSFRYSPTGRFLATEIDNLVDAQDHVILLDLEAGTERQFTSRFAHWDPAWSPDGSRIATGGLNGSVQGLYVGNTDGTGSEELLRAFPGNIGTIQDFDWSPRDDYIVLATSNTFEGDLVLFSFADSSVQNFATEPRSQNDPRFSHDGRHIVYTSFETGQENIYVKTVDGTSKWQVTTTEGYYPLWSPDDDRLYFQRGTALYEVPVDTSPVFRLTGQAREVLNLGSQFRYDLHPDGEGVLVRRLTDSQWSSTIELVHNFDVLLREIAPASN